MSWHEGREGEKGDKRGKGRERSHSSLVGEMEDGKGLRKGLWSERAFEQCESCKSRHQLETCEGRGKRGVHAHNTTDTDAS